MGAGFEYAHAFSKNFDTAIALNYSQYAFSDDLFGGTQFAVDQAGANLNTTNGIDPNERLLSIKFHGLYSDLNDRDLPTRGTKFRFGSEQGWGLGNSTAAYNRLEANFAHLFPAPGFGDSDHSFLLNLQAGTIFGDPPPIRAFNLGGPNSVRGYSPGELASGRSFALASAEYRHHLFDFSVFDYDVDTRLEVFYDYATTLGTSDDLIGFPPQTLEQPGDGQGYGLGLQLASKIALFRFGTAWNDQGDNRFYFSAGERF